MTVAQIVNATIRTAANEVGVREIGNSNRGRRVDEYQRADLLPGLGYSWCYSFQDWGMLTTLGQELCDLVWLRTASCDQGLQWARRKGIVSDTPVKGCMGLVMASRNDATHIFKVEEVFDDATQTIEGNTNNDGSANGNGVYRRHRVFSKRYLYLLWMKLLPPGATLSGQPPVLKPVTLPKSPFEGCDLYDLVDVHGTLLSKVPLLNGRTWLPAYKFAQWMHVDLAWRMDTQSVLLDKREVPAQPLLVDGRSWLPVTKMAGLLGLKAVFDEAAKKVILRK